MLDTRIWSVALTVFAALVFTTAYVSANHESRAVMQSGEGDADEPVTFRVRIQNIAPASETPTLFAPGVWALHSDADPLFTIGEADRGEGLEALAEDGDPSELVDGLLERGLKAGMFHTPVCADSPRPLEAGEFYEFEISTSPETPLLSFATMLAQSNDLFLAPAGSGISLFDDDGNPITAQFVTNRLILWDAGTEANEVTGEGPNQAPRQANANAGPVDEDTAVRPADGEFDYPGISEFVKVYIVQIPTIERDQDKETVVSSDYSVGDEFRVGDVEWRVLSAESLRHEISSQDDRRTTNERFLRVRFQFLNVGSDPLQFEAVEDLPLHDGQGRAYEHYRISGILGEEYPRDFIKNEEECFGRRWLGTWRPFELKPNKLTTCTTIFEVNVDATDLAVSLSGLQPKGDAKPRTVGLGIPSTPRRAVGRVMQVGDVRWQVLSAEDHGHVIEVDGVREKTKDRFIKVRIQVTNKGSEHLEFSGPVLRDRQGREYGSGKFNLVAESDRCVGGFGRPYRLPPNEITTCTSIYEVPQDSTRLAFVADDLEGTDAGTEIVSLGLSDSQPVRLFLVDEDVRVGDMCWRVLSVEELGQELRNEKGKKETTEGRYVQVQFQLLNLGSGTLGYGGVILEDSDGRKYTHFGERLEYIDDEVECPPSLIPPRSYPLKPNTPTVCTAIHEVARDSERFALLASDLEGYEAAVIVFVSVAEATPPRCADPGTYEVGEDCPPRVYKGEAEEGEICKWARLGDLSGDPESIIAMGQREGQFYVEVQDSDAGFTTEWELAPLDSLLTKTPLLTEFPPGMYIVGLDIAPGKYQGTPEEELFCFWQRVKDLREEEESTIEWDIPGEKFVVEVAPTDFAVEFHCPVEKVE